MEIIGIKCYILGLDSIHSDRKHKITMMYISIILFFLSNEGNAGISRPGQVWQVPFCFLPLPS